MAELPSTKKPAIFLKPEPNSTEVLAVAMIYLQLQSRGVQPAVVATSNNPALESLNLLIGEFQHISEIPAKKMVLSFPSTDTPVESVQWQQDNGELKIFITLETGELQPGKLNFSTQGANFDLLILPNVRGLAELGDFPESHANLFLETKLFSIGSELNLDEEYLFSSANKPNLTTLAEQVYTAFAGEKLDELVCQYMLAGIVLGTKSFSIDLASSETLVVMKKLVDLGARFSKNSEILALINLKPNTN